MPGIVKVILGLFLTACIVAAPLGLLYLLHIKSIIEVRIPKRLRIGWFKDYISPEEKAAIQAEILRLAKIERQKELNLRLAIKPTNKGFHISDSMFSDNDSKLMDDPNIGFEQHDAVT